MVNGRGVHIPWSRKCNVMQAELSGKYSSMWNRKRCSVYSRIVQIKFPVAKHITVFNKAANVMLDSAPMGRYGFDVNAGRMYPENWKSERKNRYPVMGPQNIGTTYHSATVRCCRGNRQPLMFIVA